MIERQNINYFSIAFSFICALLLTIMPLPHFLIWFRPQWVLLVLLFWVITKPAYCGVVLAWSVGFITDLLTGTPLCQQALIFALLAYFALKLHQILVHSPRWQQAVIIGVFAGFAMVLQSVIGGMMGHTAPVMRNELSVLSTVLMWPLLYALFDQSKTRMYL